MWNRNHLTRQEIYRHERVRRRSKGWNQRWSRSRIWLDMYFQICDDILERVSRALPEVAASIHATNKKANGYWKNSDFKRVSASKGLKPWMPSLCSDRWPSRGGIQVRWQLFLGIKWTSEWCTAQVRPSRIMFQNTTSFTTPDLNQAS